MDICCYYIILTVSFTNSFNKLYNSFTFSYSVCFKFWCSCINPFDVMLTSYIMHWFDVILIFPCSNIVYVCVKLLSLG